MLRPVLDFSVCQSCTPCQARPACRTRAVVQIDPGEPPYIALDRCSGCSACVKACNFAAIRMRDTGAVVGHTSPSAHP